MQGIFINYRREDTEGYAIILQERLTRHFGEGQVFMDVDNIEPGVDFMEAINKSLDGCQVVLVLIGQRWLDATDDQDSRRLDNPQDPLRIEIETALGSDSRVIPILVRGATMPEGDKLPESLAPLTRRHAIEISSSRRDYDIEKLLTTLEKIPGLEPVATSEAREQPVEPAPAPAPPRSNALKHGIAGAGIALLLLITVALFTDNETAAPVPEAAIVAPATLPAPVRMAKPVPTPKPTPATLTNVNLSGTWYDDDGTRFEVSHKGKRVIAAGYNLFGMTSKQLHGTLQGNTIEFTLQDGFVTTDGVATLNEDGVHIDYTLTQGNYSENGQLHLDHTPN